MKSLIRKILKEQTHVNDYGSLKGFSFGIHYPFDEVEMMVKWFSDEHSEQMYDDGWEITSTNAEYPKEKYDSPKGFWRIVLSDIGEGGTVNSEMEADDKAKMLGLLVDDYGIVIGYKEHNLVEEYNG